MICNFQWPNVSISAAFRESAWGISSTRGVAGSFEPFAEGPSVNAGMLNIPFHKIDDVGIVTETALLSGFGLGTGAFGGLQIPWVDLKNMKAPLRSAPFGGSGSTARTPGPGTRVSTALGAQKAMEAADFEGLCLVGTVQGVYGGVSGSMSTRVFASQSCFSLSLPPAAQVALIRGIALCWGVGFATALGATLRPTPSASRLTPSSRRPFSRI